MRHSLGPPPPDRQSLLAQDALQCRCIVLPRVSERSASRNSTLITDRMFACIDTDTVRARLPKRGSNSTRRRRSISCSRTRSSNGPRFSCTGKASAEPSPSFSRVRTLSACVESLSCFCNSRPNGKAHHLACLFAQVRGLIIENTFLSLVSIF